MKKLFITLIGFIPFISTAQLNSSASLGWDTHGRAIAVWSIGYEKFLFNINAEIRPSLTRNVYNHNYVGGRFSINLLSPEGEYLTGLSVLPGVGYFYDLKSQDKTNLNKYFWAPVLKSIIMITENGGLTFDGMYINQSFQFTIGMQFKFSNKDHPY